MKSTTDSDVTALLRFAVVFAFRLAIFFARTAAGRFSAGMSATSWK